MNRLISIIFLLGLSFPLFASYTGRVFIDLNNNDVFDKGEKTLKGVKVSDGLNVVKTGTDGSFTLPGHARERFIFITTPSGYKTLSRHYYKIEAFEKEYNFALLPYDAGIGVNGSHSFVQVADTEIFNTDNNEVWAKNIRDYVQNQKSAFIIHTGDICYEKGLKEHISLMNTENMGKPVYYCIGNHDLVKGKYGEELFEKIYGPVYYSFEVAGVHYIVTPMPGGDYATGYTKDDVCRWLKNDLANVRPGTPIMVFNHDLLTHGDTFVYKGENGDSVNLNEYNLKAWIYGHWHINHMKKQGDVYTICTSSLDKGGIDHAKSAFRVIHVGSHGNFNSELRYSYLDRNICIASPQGGTSSKTIVVNTYSTISPVCDVECTCLDAGKVIFKNRKLTQATDWTWTGELPISDKYYNKVLTLRAKTFFEDGRTAEADCDFIYFADKCEVKVKENWSNLLGNASHTAVADSLGEDLQLAWVKNVGANLYMTSPLIYDGGVYTASIDEDLNGKAYIYAFEAINGTLLWKYKVRSSVKNTIAADSGIILAQDVLGYLYAIDAKEGRLCWESKLPVRSLPALVDGLVAENGVVYAGTGKGLSAFDVKTGKCIWRNQEWSQGEGTTSTLSVGNGVLVGSVQWTGLYGNDIKTGKMLWRRSDYGLHNRAASAAIHNGLLYIISGKSLFILEVTTGRIVVRKELPYNVDVTSTPLLTDDEIIFGTAEEGLVAVDSRTLEEKWHFMVGDALIYTAPYRRPVSGTIETSPVLAGNTIYVGASDGVLYAVDVKTGKKCWKHKMGAPIFGTVAISGNTLIVSDFGGNIYAFCAKNRETGIFKNKQKKIE